MKPLQTEAAFRRYEPLIAQIIGRFPMETRLSLPGFSPVTIESRIREAAKGYFVNNYHSDVIDRQNFVSYWPRVRITRDEHGCVARCVGEQPQVQTKPQLAELTKSWSEADIRALCQLISSGHITDRTAVLTVLDDDVLNEILDGYDVAATRENGVLYLL